MARMKKNPLDSILGATEPEQNETLVIEPAGPFDGDREREALGIQIQEEKPGAAGRPRKELIRHGAQAGMTEDFTRVTFIMRVDTLNKLKDYAYTERLSLKEAVESIIGGFLEDKTDLLPHKRK